MLTPQFLLGLHHELVIDNFAGGGGASTGIERALGRPVDHAINHDHIALGMHRINHPQTIHHCEDVFDIDPLTITEGRPVGLGWFSPDCKHHSKAKGGKPVEKRIRGLAFVMLRWAKAAPPRIIMMENVEEIQDWGPLVKMQKNGNWGMYPDPRHKGRTWQALLACLGKGIRPNHPDIKEILDVLDGHVTKADLVKGFGYHLEYRERRAANAGAPTIRKRLFLIGRRDGKPIVWPEPTHADPKTLKAVNKAMGIKVKPWRTVAECIDWSLPCPSIFLSGDAAKKARCKRPLADASLRRIAKGVGRYVLHSDRPFLVSLTHQGGDRVESVDDPIRTITGAHRGEKAVVAPVMSKFHGNHHGRSDGSTRNHEVSEPLLSQDTSNRFGLTEAKLAPFLTEHANATNQRNMPADEPMRTTCAEVKGGHFALVAPVVVNTCNGKFDDAPSRSRSAEEPLPTVTSGPKFAMVTGTLIQTGYGEREGQEPRALDPQKPLGTVVAGGCKHAVVTGTLIGVGGRAGQSRPRALDEPIHTGTAKADTSLAAVSMVKMRGDNVGDEADAPMHTASAGGNHHGVVTAFLAQHNGGFNTTDGHDAREPVSTISSKGSQQQVVAASLVRQFGASIGQEADAPAPTVVAGGGGKTGLLAAHLTKFCTGSVGSELSQPLPTITAGSHRPETHGGAASTHGLVAASVAVYHGTEVDGHGADEPAHTATTRNRLGVVQSQLVNPLTPEQEAGALRVAAFLREHGIEFEGPYAMVGGYVIIDLGMRMLTPRELFLAQGFPPDYVIDKAWLIDEHTGALTEVALTKEQQIRMCGNSVCPPEAEALVRANAPDLCLGHPSITKTRRKAACAV